MFHHVEVIYNRIRISIAEMKHRRGEEQIDHHPEVVYTFLPGLYRV